MRRGEGEFALWWARRFFERTARAGVVEEDPVSREMSRGS